MSIKNILVATDFTSRADRAVDRGLQMSRDSKLPVRFIYAVDPGKTNAPTMQQRERMMEQCVGYPAGTDLGGGGIEYAYPEGSAPTAIAQACDADDRNLLLIGPARYNTLGDFFLGTAVDYVLRNTTTPTIVVKKRVRKAYDQIVAGTDFSLGSAHAIIEAARMFPDAAIHVTHAWHVPFSGFQRDSYVADETEAGDQAKLDTFVAMLAEQEPRLADATTSMVQGGAFQAVKGALETHPDALVVLGSHGASGFRQATLGSNTSDMLRFIDADILVVNTATAKA